MNFKDKNLNFICGLKTPVLQSPIHFFRKTNWVTNLHTSFLVSFAYFWDILAFCKIPESWSRARPSPSLDSSDEIRVQVFQKFPIQSRFNAESWLRPITSLDDQNLLPILVPWFEHYSNIIYIVFSGWSHWR